MSMKGVKFRKLPNCIIPRGGDERRKHVKFVA